MSSDPTLPLPDHELTLIKKWIERHYNEEDDVFFVSSPIDSPNGGQCYEFEVVWLSIFKIKGTVCAPGSIEAGFYVYIPLRGWVYVIGIKGDLREGIIVKFDIGIIKGTLKFYLKNGNEVWLDYDVIVLGKRYKGTVKLFTLPWTVLESIAPAA